MNKNLRKSRGLQSTIKKRPKKSMNEAQKKSVGQGFSPAKQKIGMNGILLEDQ